MPRLDTTGHKWPFVLENIKSFRRLFMRQPKVVNETSFHYYHRLQEIKRFIEEHYMEEISLKKAARIAGLEKKYFSSFFHSKVGIGFKDWLTHLRVARAMDLMKVEDYTIAEVGYSAGFKDIRTFERAFKRCTKRTPRDFKNGVRKTIAGKITIFAQFFWISAAYPSFFAGHLLIIFNLGLFCVWSQL
jgi:AraC-like DNA-binding protein